MACVVSAGGRVLCLQGYSFRDFCVLVSTFAQVTSISGAFGGIRGVLARRAALQPCCTYHTTPECGVCHQASLVRCMPSAAFFPHFVDICIPTHSALHPPITTPPPHPTPPPPVHAQIVGQHLLQRRTMPAAGPGMRGSMRGGMHASSGFGGMAAVRPARDRVMAVPQPHLGVAVSASKSHIDMMR